MIAAGQSRRRAWQPIALTAQAPAGLVAAISFAGGRGSRDDDDVCNLDGLVQAFATFGRTSRVPTPWALRQQRSLFLAPTSRAASMTGSAPVAATRHSSRSAALTATTATTLYSGRRVVRNGRPGVDAFPRERGPIGRDISEPARPPAAAAPAERGRARRVRALSRQPAAAQGASRCRRTAATAGAPDARRPKTPGATLLAACMKWSPTCTLYAVDDQRAEPAPSDRRRTRAPARARRRAPQGRFVNSESPYEGAMARTGQLRSERDVETIGARHAAVGADLRPCRETATRTSRARRPGFPMAGPSSAPAKRRPPGPRSGGSSSEKPQDTNLPADIAEAVVFVESGYNPAVIGSVGEIGLMQVRPETAAMLGFRGSDAELAEPDINIHYGVLYLSRAWRLDGRGHLPRPR